MRTWISTTRAAVVVGVLGLGSIGFAQVPEPTPKALEQAIEHRWEDDATLKACKGCDLDVEVTGDVAKISGEVPTAALKARAAKLANVTGVARIDNQIEIVAPGSAADKTREGLNKAANKTADGVGTAANKTAEGVSTAANKTGDALAKTGEVIDDSWITTKVKSKYVGEKSVDGSDISVETKNNIVTLTGTVPSTSAHAAALRIARDTKGVKKVVDNLRIAPKTN
jgi:osmotically-inducible protein OsmY